MKNYKVWSLNFDLVCQLVFILFRSGAELYELHKGEPSFRCCTLCLIRHKCHLNMVVSVGAFMGRIDFNDLGQGWQPFPLRFV